MANTTNQNGETMRGVQPPPPPPAGWVPPPPPPHQSVAQPRARLPWWAKLCVVIVAGMVPMGFCHCVYSGPGSPTICMKESWGISDTFVNTDDYVGKPLITLVGKANVVRALIQCEILERPNFDRD